MEVGAERKPTVKYEVRNGGRVTEEEFLELWQRHELACFAFEYFFLYGEKWVSEHQAWIEWKFKREWKRKSKKEKQDRFDQFCELLKGGI